MHRCPRIEGNGLFSKHMEPNNSSRKPPEPFMALNACAGEEMPMFAGFNTAVASKTWCATAIELDLMCTGAVNSEVPHHVHGWPIEEDLCGNFSAI